MLVICKTIQYDKRLNEAGGLFHPCQFGAPRFPRSGTRLIGTALEVHPAKMGSDPIYAFG